MSNAAAEIVDRYFNAQNTDDIAALSACFADDATVLDEGGTIVGPERIGAWMAEARRKYGQVAEPLETSERDGATIVKARVTGNFPGSPAVLEHAFRLAGGRIVSLEIR